MRMLLHVRIPNSEFNAAVRDGTVAQKIGRILEESKPEAAYFTNYDGQRGAILIVDVKEPSQVPALAEPWFLAFNADVQFHVAMTPDDLASAGIGELGKKWG